MLNISETISEADILEAKTALRATLQQQDPTLDLSAGGPVDGLLVDGNAAIVARNDADRSANQHFRVGGIT